MSVRGFDVARSEIEIPKESCVYLHAVGLAGAAGRSETNPYMLEEKGIDGRTFGFAWENGGLRYYLSILPPDLATIGRGGVLLLSKQDSIRLRGVHESVLNDLRLHGALLPFGFGTVTIGWETLQTQLKRESARFMLAVRKLEATRVWRLQVSALDRRFADLQRNDTVEKRRESDRHRMSYSVSRGVSPRMDIRALEHVLMKQRNLAESIHAALVPIAEKASVEKMITLQAGSSDDWKVILESTYELPSTMISRFHRTVTGLQYQYVLLELMFKVTGDLAEIALHPVMA